MNSGKTDFARSDALPCRLCGGTARFQFSHQVLDKYPVGYWRCEACQSLETDPPHWLDESYATLTADTGMVARNWQMAQITSLLLGLAGVGPDIACMDWGGGNGLFCRMMRDQGYNFVSDDKYADPFYSRGFTRQDCGITRSDIVTSFELFEHLPDPASELKEILSFEPKLWIFSTQLYSSQDKTWKYLGPDLGRHVFFYSHAGLAKFAEANGFEFFRGRDLHMLVRRGGHGYLKGALKRRFAAGLLAGSKPALLLASFNFLSRQRKAYLRWRADSAKAKQTASARKEAA
jgi:hypothetical protein